MQTTQWIVITGAPCSGKTCVIDALARRGHRVKPEVARAYIDAEMGRGRTLAQVRADEAAFERHILYAKREIEAALPPDEPIFFDRAVPDSIAYFRLAGLDTAEPLALSRRFAYRRIFLFDRLALDRDRVRVEDDRAAALLDVYLEEAYRGLGYEPLRVPLLAVGGRVAFILTHLQP